MSMLVPGTRGWELWQQAADGTYSRSAESDSPRAADLQAPAGNLAMLFPVRGWNALPFRAPSADDALFDDLAGMHAERLGVRWDPMGGQLIDVFVVAKEEDAAILLTVVLKAPVEDMPARTPQEFDLSARAFAVDGDAIAVWMELGRWVFAFYKDGKLLYAQATSSEAQDPDAAVLREIRLASSQLGIQGLAIRPQVAWVWSEGSNAGVLAEGLQVPVRLSPRPDPKLPQPHSRLLPADVRAARKAAQARRTQVIGIAALVLVYLGVAGYFGYGLYKKRQEVAVLQKSAESTAPKSKRLEFEKFRSTWSELDLVLNKSRWPVPLMNLVSTAAGLNNKLRFKSVEIDENSIKVVGDAPDFAPANDFSAHLRNPGFSLSAYDWNTPSATNTNKGWDFVYIGTLKK